MTCRAMTFDQFSLTTASDAKDRAFRIVLMPGELLRIPRTRRSLRVVSGSAWVTHNGQDHDLGMGDVLPLVRTRQEALVSAEGQPLFLEIA